MCFKLASHTKLYISMESLSSVFFFFLSCRSNTCFRGKVAVLTEERDVARSHEEELFAKLTDQTEDLEALQESYVSLTDR